MKLIRWLLAVALLGFVGADFDLRELPITSKLYDEPGYWRQIKGDPAIRGAVFHRLQAQPLQGRMVQESVGHHGTV